MTSWRRKLPPVMMRNWMSASCRAANTFSRSACRSGLSTIGKQKLELLPFSRGMMKRLSPRNSRWNSARFVAPPGREARQLLELLAADGAAHLERPHVVARQDEAVGLEVVAAAPLEQRRVLGQVARPAVGANALAQMRGLLVVGEDHAAFHGRDMVREEEGEGVHRRRRCRLFRLASSASIDSQLSSNR